MCLAPYPKDQDGLLNPPRDFPTQEAGGILWSTLTLVETHRTN